VEGDIEHACSLHTITDIQRGAFSQAILSPSSVIHEKIEAFNRTLANIYGNNG